MHVAQGRREVGRRVPQWRDRRRCVRVLRLDGGRGQRAENLPAFKRPAVEQTRGAALLPAWSALLEPGTTHTYTWSALSLKMLFEMLFSSVLSLAAHGGIASTSGDIVGVDMVDEAVVEFNRPALCYHTCLSTPCIQEGNASCPKPDTKPYYIYKGWAISKYNASGSMSEWQLCLSGSSLSARLEEHAGDVWQRLGDRLLGDAD